MPKITDVYFVTLRIECAKPIPDIGKFVEGRAYAMQDVEGTEIISVEHSTPNAEASNQHSGS